MIARRSLVRRALLALAAPVLLAAVAAPAAAQKAKGKGHDDHDARNASSVQVTKTKTTQTTRIGSKPIVMPKSKPAAKPAAKSKRIPPGQAKKRVTHAQAVDASRSVLIQQGYKVSRVEQVGDTRVIYYYRGNNGRGKGHGPMRRMVLRPRAERFDVDGAPSKEVMAAIVRKMGL